MRHPFAFLIGALAALTLLSTATAASEATKRITGLFSPFLAEQITLSPDGKRIAYTQHAGKELRVIIMTLESPYHKVTISVADGRDVTFSKEKAPVELRFLRWATANRLVFAPTAETITFPGPMGQKIISPIQAIDADGQNPKTLMDGPDFLGFYIDPITADSKDVPRPTSIIGFPDRDRRHLLIQARGRVIRVAAPAPEGSIPQVAGGLSAMTIPVVVPTSLFSVDVVTGKYTQVDDEYVEGTVAYDRQGRSRISQTTPDAAAERVFSLVGRSPVKFTEPWLGPLAGRFTATAENYFGERAYPLGFDVDPDLVYIASNVGRDTFGIYALNVKTRQRTGFALEHPHVDLAPLDASYPSPELVFDEAQGKLVGVRVAGPPPVAVWHDPELAAAQAAMERKFPRRSVELLEWSDDRSVLLLRVTGGTEPGRYFVHQKAGNLEREIFRRAPWLDSATLHPTEPFAFDSPAGVHLTGYVTRPRETRLNPPPAVVMFADGFVAQAHPEFDRQAQVLAGMGLVVIRLNHRGLRGFGIHHRDTAAAGIDRAPVDDAVAALDWVGARVPIDRRRVATMGSRHGGYFAVRATQLRPELFRCAVAFNAPLDPVMWVTRTPNIESRASVNFRGEAIQTYLERSGADLAKLSVFDRPETLTRPVFLALDPAGAEAITATNSRLRSHLKRFQVDFDYVELNTGFREGLPKASGDVYGRLEEFFNLHLYNYKVKVGETKEIK